MSLPAIARRVDLVATRVLPGSGPQDDWGRTPRAAPVTVASWRGEVQPRKARGGAGEVQTADGQGPAVGDHIVFADVIDILTGDIIHTVPDDGLRYRVERVDRIGRGHRLDHLEIGANLVTAAIPV